jgi:tetraacyldisaccharide-1-P 4'-kinase
LDIVLLDARNPFGPLLPEGRFRESPVALKRADAIVFSKSDHRYPLAGDFSYPSSLTKAVNVKASVYYGEIQQMHGVPAAMPLGNNKTYFAVCGIANPARFLEALKSKGLYVDGVLELGDHEPVVLERLKEMNLKNWPIVTTLKDWCRSKAVFEQLDVGVWVLPMDVELPKELSEKISQLLAV